VPADETTLHHTRALFFIAFLQNQKRVISLTLPSARIMQATAGSRKGKANRPKRQERQEKNAEKSGNAEKYSRN
jgi:hypothetical protein